jgi:hypothetical protein
MNRPRDRRRASALQLTLERYERMLADGVSPEKARSEASGALTGSDARAFAIAAGLRETGERTAATPDPAFARAFAARLRTAEIRTPRLQVVRPRFNFVPLAAAACIALFAALLVPALQSLPGDRLYGLKSVSEDSRLLFASGSTEARVRLDLAEERFSEVERLIDRSATRDLALSPGVYALPSPEDITDPELAALIEDALFEAGRHLQIASDILTKQPADATDLDELVAVSRRGHVLATRMAEDLPTKGQVPVLNTVVKLAKIEAAAKAARTKADPKATPPPCATPTATPVPTDASADVAVTATPTAVESSTPEPTSTPEATPCISPKPTPTATPTESPTAEPSMEPTLTPGVEDGDGVDQSSDGEQFEGDGSTENTSGEPEGADTSSA